MFHTQLIHFSGLFLKKKRSFSFSLSPPCHWRNWFIRGREKSFLPFTGDAAGAVFPIGKEGFPDPGARWRKSTWGKWSSKSQNRNYKLKRCSKTHDISQELSPFRIAFCRSAAPKLKIRRSAEAWREASQNMILLLTKREHTHTHTQRDIYRSCLLRFH